MTTATATTTRVRPLDPQRHLARTSLLVAAAPAWGRCKIVETGEIAYLVPSQTKPGAFHVTTVEQCDCKGFGFRRNCAHVAAVREREGWGR